MVQHVTLDDFVVQALVPALPILLLGYRQITEQLDAARRVERLKDHAKRLWDEVVSGMTVAGRLAHREICKTKFSRAVRAALSYSISCSNFCATTSKPK